MLLAQEKLTKVIEKAEKNGFDLNNWAHKEYMISPNRIHWKESVISDLIDMGYKLLLIDHEFCKAYFGETKCCSNCGFAQHTNRNNITYSTCACGASWVYIWEFHLQEVVISDNMLNYYYERL